MSDRGGFERGFGGRGRGEGGRGRGEGGRGDRRGDGRGRGRGKRDEEERWTPLTKLGRLVQQVREKRSGLKRRGEQDSGSAREREKGGERLIAPAIASGGRMRRLQLLL